AKTIMRRFDRCLAYDEEAAQRLRALGAQAWRVEVTGPLEEGTAALPHDEEDRRDLADALATRPVWMAAHAPADEIAFLLEAHKEAVRRSHRYLLILHPNPDQDSAALAAAVREAGLSVALRSEVFVPEEDDQVLIADLPDERGLWYRVAPITYMGGTFANMPSHNPFEAASLGSAIIHGPNIARFRGNFDRLSEAQGTVALTAPGHLAAALNDLNFPDRAARLAHAAWDVSSSGAEVTDRVIALLKAALPQPRA
ncbi:MAG: 3-deoxy-D-manno-octulosonic acid transferase, partial [Pseudomonadota bacterium]